MRQARRERSNTRQLSQDTSKNWRRTGKRASKDKRRSKAGGTKAEQKLGSAGQPSREEVRLKEELEKRDRQIEELQGALDDLRRQLRPAQGGREEGQRKHASAMR